MGRKKGYNAAKERSGPSKEVLDCEIEMVQNGFLNAKNLSHTV